MDSCATLEFEPIYGWGWHQGADAFDVPVRLAVLVSCMAPGLVRGTVLAPAELAEAEAVLSLRNEQAGLQQWSATFSGGSLQAPVTGFVQSPSSTPNNSSKPTPLRGAA